ncbi:RecB family exonuclease [Candidatus Poribacteria bacterium]
MKLSYSKLSSFMSCGFLYRLKYIEKIPARPKPHLGFGRILHCTLDKFYSLDTHAPSLNDLLRIYKGYWKIGSTSYERHYAKGLRILERYYELNMGERHRTVYVEQPFSIPIGRHMLAGRFDRVDCIDENTYEIIDYKAAKQVATQEQVDSALQLGIYGLAFKLTTGKLPLLSFYFLPENTKVTSKRTDSDIYRLKAGLDAMVEKLMSGEHFESQEGVECKWCDYKSYCPLKTETPLELPSREIQPELELTFHRS